MPIEHISDTARWVAIYRALESDRPDAIFHDPYARRIAGERGQGIVDELPSKGQMAWAIVVRTALIDELVLAAVHQGADLILNLAAGLDTRPWRLTLPASLRWVDVDLPAILDHKTTTMAGIPAHCRYEAIRLDLTDIPRRQALFAQLGADTTRVLVITEGLLIYLPPDEVGALATDLHAQPTFRSWTFDLVGAGLLQMMKRRRGKGFSATSLFRFAPAEGTAFFRAFGWREAQFRSFWEESRRLNRQMRMSWVWKLVTRFQSRKRRQQMHRMSGVVLLQRE